MKRFYSILIIVLLLTSLSINAQPWVQNNSIFNPSGVPSLPFSQPRFADLDNDGDIDLIISSIDENPFYLQNIGDATNPHFIPGNDIFANVGELDAEISVFKDIDNDGDFDMICGGFSGLNLYENNGDDNNPSFTHIGGFFTSVISGQNPIPDMADLDADGDLDLVVGFSESGEVKIYKNTGSSTLAVFSETNMYVIDDVGLYAYPSFCDLDNDNDFDLVVGRDGLGFRYYENTGTSQNANWENILGFFGDIGNQGYFNSPGFADLNGDGTFDFVFGTADGPLSYYVNSGTTESPAWDENTSLFGGVIDPGGASNPILYDYDDDGDLDMFSGSQMGDIVYYKNIGSITGPAWQENSSPFTSLKHSIYSAVAIGDVNNNGLPDAIVGDLSGKLYFHKNTGFGFEFESDVLQDMNFGGWSSPRLIDFDKDNDLDIIVGSENGSLNYIENQGSPDIADWVLIPDYFGSFDAGGNCVPTIADLDFDGDYDVLCGNISGEILFLENQDGNWIENNTIVEGLSGGQNTSPALADMDADGDNDLVLGEYSGVFSYYRNDFLLVNSSNITNNQINSKIYPNPFINYLNIQYSLIQKSDVIIQVINVNGKIVFEEKIRNQKNGKHNFNFNATSFPKGIYFVKILNQGKIETLKTIKN